MLNFNFPNMYKDKLEDHLYGYISVEEIEDIRDKACIGPDVVPTKSSSNL